MSSPSGSQTNQCDSRRRIETKRKGGPEKEEENSITFGQEIDGQLFYPVRCIARSNRRKETAALFWCSRTSPPVLDQISGFNGLRLDRVIDICSFGNCSSLPPKRPIDSHRWFVAIQLQVPDKLLLCSIHRLHNYSGRASQVKRMNGLAFLRSSKDSISSRR